MKRMRIHIDTSVIGGYFDEEFEEDTKLFFDRVKKDELAIVISDILELELIEAPARKRISQKIQ